MRLFPISWNRERIMVNSKSGVSKNAPPVTFGHFAITNAEEAYGIDYGDFHGLDKKTHKLQKVDWFSPLSPLSLYIHH